MSVAAAPAMAGRTTRLTALVGQAEVERIAKRAEAAGLWGQGSGEQDGGPSDTPGAPGDDHRDHPA